MKDITGIIDNLIVRQASGHHVISIFIPSLLPPVKKNVAVISVFGIVNYRYVIHNALRVRLGTQTLLVACQRVHDAPQVIQHTMVMVNV